MALFFTKPLQKVPLPTMTAEAHCCNDCDQYNTISPSLYASGAMGGRRSSTLHTTIESSRSIGTEASIPKELSLCSDLALRSKDRSGDLGVISGRFFEGSALQALHANHFPALGTQLSRDVPQLQVVQILSCATPRCLGLLGPDVNPNPQISLAHIPYPRHDRAYPPRKRSL